MNKIVTAMTLMVMLVFWYAEAQSIEDRFKPIREGASVFTTLKGKTVKNIQGDDLGIITEVVKGPGGRVAFAMVNFSASDSARKIIAVPIGALSCNEQNCVINASRETMRATPYFVSKDDLAKTARAADIYLNFGVQPYWSGEGLGK